MCGRNPMIGVLDQVQMFDEKIAPARPISEQFCNLMASGGVDLTPFRRRLGAPASLSWVVESPNLMHVLSHKRFIPLDLYKPL